LTDANAGRYGSGIMKKSLSLRPVKKLALTRKTLARVAGEEVSRLDLIAVAGAVRASPLDRRDPGDRNP
jgi:hypothetical protein